MRVLTIILIFSQMICAQTDIINSPFLISNSGGEWITDNYNLCFSVGEIAIETHIPQDIILTQGFHQESNYQITTLMSSCMRNQLGRATPLLEAPHTHQPFYSHTKP